jgi:hypothetical protein
VRDNRATPGTVAWDFRWGKRNSASIMRRHTDGFRVCADGESMSSIPQGETFAPTFRSGKWKDDEAMVSVGTLKPFRNVPVDAL